MNISRIGVIGIGSLGGFVAQAISELDITRKLVLIDYDIVEEKNLINSIYRLCDINKYKTSALHDIIKEQNHNNIQIEILTNKYEEGKIQIPDVDLLIDCRDCVCNRNNIDVRLFISSRYLIIDCRKNIIYDNDYEGRYITKLTKNDLRKASLIFTSFIQDNFIEYMMNNQLIKEIDIDYLNKMSNDIRNQNEDRNIIIDSEISNKLLNLEDNIGEIIFENRKKDLMITMNNNKSTQLIPKKSIKNPIDVISILSQMTNNSNNSQYYYIISMTNKQNFCHIELIQESGAA